TKVISLAPQEPLKVRMGKDLPLNSPALVTAGTAYGSLPYRKSLNLQRQFRLKGNQGFGYSLATGVNAIRRGPLTRWNSQSQNLRRLHHDDIRSELACSPSQRRRRTGPG